MSTDNKEELKYQDVLLETLKEISTTLKHHINSDETKFGLMVDKLHSLDTNLSNLLILNNENLKNHIIAMDKMQSMVMDHNKFIYDSKDGASIRIMTLENSEKNRAWNFRAIWVAILSLLTKFLYDLLK